MRMRHRLPALAAILFALLTFGPVGAGSAQPDGDPSTDPRTEPVRVVVHTLEPFVLRTNGTQLTGFSIDLWEEVARRLGWETEYVMTDNVRGQLDAVRTGAADVAVGAISITADRQMSFDFSHPTLEAGLQIIVPAHDPSPTTPAFNGFFGLLFSRPMLIWLGVAMAMSVLPAHIFWLVERRGEQPRVARTYLPGILQSFEWGISALIGRQSLFASKPLTRTIAVIWSFAGIVFVSFYTASLSATLTVTKLDAQINGPADLYGKKVATVAGTTAAMYLDGMGIGTTKTDTIEQSYDLLRNDGYDAVVYDAPVLRYYVAHRGQGVAVTAGPMFRDEHQGFALALNSPLRKPVNQVLYRMREDGTYQLIKQKWFGDDLATAGKTR